MIPISKPLLGAGERAAVNRVLKSGIIAAGPVVKEFEDKFAAYNGAKHAIAVSNGTCAIHAALYGLGIAAGDKVIVPSFTFIATANAVIHAGAEPVFADIDENTFNIDPDYMESILKKDINGKIKAVIVVHLFGRVCPMDRIMKTARKYGICVIEDAAQAHGAKYRGKMAGTFGDAGTFSMYATKNMTTGEGGMVITDRSDTEKTVRSFINHGSEDVYYHTRLGYNYRTTDIEAAIGVVQLKKLETFNKKRRKNAQRYAKMLGKYDWLVLPEEERGEHHIYHQYTVRVKRGLRDRLAVFLRDNGVGAKVFYPIPLHKQPFYLNKMKKKIKLPVSEKAAGEVISIPAHPGLRAKDFFRIKKVFEKFAGSI